MSDKPVVRAMRLGPLFKDWPHDSLDGVCTQCGGQCDGRDCGMHAAGCVFGGPTDETSFWMIAEGCELYHGEPKT